MIGYKDMLTDLPDSAYEEAVGFLNDCLADDAAAMLAWQDEMAREHDNATKQIDNPYKKGA